MIITKKYGYIEELYKKKKKKNEISKAKKMCLLLKIKKLNIANRRMSILKAKDVFHKINKPRN